jgi:hypothetical protein
MTTIFGDTMNAGQYVPADCLLPLVSAQNPSTEVRNSVRQMLDACDPFAKNWTVCRIVINIADGNLTVLRWA